MAFKLPNDQDLTEEQTKIVSLPPNKNFVIQGGPGTGKTVMAIYRAGQIARNPNAKVLVLVYNRPLCDFIRQSPHLQNEYYENVEVNTRDAWTSDFYSTLKRKVPTNDAAGGRDWEKIGNLLQEIGNAAKEKSKACYHHIIIDESQDFHPALLKGLSAIAQNITCFIDPHQMVSPDGNQTDLLQTLNTLGVFAPVSLTRNFRNTRQIRDASVLFWQGKPGEPTPAEAEFDGPKPRMIQCATNNGSYDFADQNQKMLSVIQNNLEKEIGVLVDAGGSLKNTIKFLRDALGDSVQAHVAEGRDRERIDFGKTGVKILTHGTMKGLEFDLLLIPGLDYANSNQSDDICRNRLYVGFSRPLKELFIFFFKNISAMPPRRRPILRPIFDHPELFDWERTNTAPGSRHNQIQQSLLVDFLND